MYRQRQQLSTHILTWRLSHIPSNTLLGQKYQIIVVSAASAVSVHNVTKTNET